MKRPNKHLTIGAIAAGIALFAGSAIVSGAGAGDDGTVLVPVVPVRVLDTRLADSPIATMGADESATVSFVGEVPVGTRAVDVNVTTTGGTVPSFLAVYPTGSERPITSAVNWNGPTSQANSIAVKLNNNYEIDIYNAFGTVDVVIDLMGYYIDAPGGGQVGTTGRDGADGMDGADGRDGTDGLDGLNGVAGIQGLTGPAGMSGLEIVVGTSSADDSEPRTVVATCPSGKVAVGGGYRTTNVSSESSISISNSYPSSATEWTASGSVIFVGAGMSFSLTAYVICATSPSIP
jgi:hypothetical protein